MPGFFYEYLEDLEPFVVAGSDEFLGMELHCDQIVAFVGLNYAVVAVSSDLQAGSDIFDRLVM